jgi:phosphoribosylamine--glycine ligase/phosphoribosylformylglycinamidine cyclo-ligase
MCLALQVRIVIIVHFTITLNLHVHAGNEVVVEELLIGPEVSVLAFSDGYTIVPLPAAQDHKRIGEGDVGLNTGGMGAYAPAPVATPAILSKIMTESLRPTIDGMRKEGRLWFALLPDTESYQ